ncbi:MAG: peptide-methionine (S)-S-oxide reductase [Synergistaceae bacterium]|jgi:peptide-methionine (S)-S-oxide reductase|nr:peptide-methionine (S)-S-oxide reductase [Synergistaceae bacterium]
MAPQRLETTVFAMGSYLRTEARFGVIRGVWKTAVGYAGGKYATPSVSDTRDHIEAVRVEYDPVTISYGQLLDMFLGWGSSLGDPCFPRYASCIFIKNDFEKRMAQAATDRYRLRPEASPPTRIAAYRTFYMGPNRFQKYFLRSLPWLMQDLKHFYSDEKSFIRSTLAMRLNGIVGQLLPPAHLPENFELYDLSEDILCTLKKYLVS